MKYHQMIALIIFALLGIGALLQPILLHEYKVAKCIAVNIEASPNWDEESIAAFCVGTVN